MNEQIMNLMKMQGEIRVNVLMRYGMNQEDALQQSGIILDLFLNSEIAKKEYSEAYEELEKENKLNA